MPRVARKKKATNRRLNRMEKNVLKNNAVLGGKRSGFSSAAMELGKTYLNTDKSAVEVDTDKSHLEMLLQIQSDTLSRLFGLRDQVQSIADRLYGPQPESTGDKDPGPPGGTIGNLQWQMGNSMRVIESIRAQLARIQSV